MFNTVQSVFLKRGSSLDRFQYLIGLATLFALLPADWISSNWDFSLQKMAYSILETPPDLKGYTNFNWKLTLKSGIASRFLLLVGCLLLMRQVYRPTWKWIICGIISFTGLQAVTIWSSEILTFGVIGGSLLDKSRFTWESLPVIIGGFACLLTPLFKLSDPVDEVTSNAKGLPPERFARKYCIAVLIWWSFTVIFSLLTQIPELYYLKHFLFFAVINIGFWAIFILGGVYLLIQRLRNIGQPLTWLLILLWMPALFAAHWAVFSIWGNPWWLKFLTAISQWGVDLIMLGIVALFLIPEQMREPKPIA